MKYRSIDRLFKKAEYKLHREMDIGKLLKRNRDCQNVVKSLQTSKVFDRNTLQKEYQTMYDNVVNVDIDTEQSIEEEY